MISYYSKTKNQVLNLLSTNFSTGISQKEAEYRLQKTGKNKITHEKKISKINIFLQQFKNPLIYILLAAIIFSLTIKEFLDASVILAIVLLNSVLGYYQEYKAERALELLKKISAPTARVLRNKKIRIIKAENVVPGDILILETGDKIPADARLLTTSNLQTNEAILTGESTPVNKTTKAISKKVTIADQTNMVFAGTIVSYGRAKAIVTATGNRTEFGRIAFSLKQIKEEETPLQKKLTKFSERRGMLMVWLAILLIIIELLRKIPVTDAFMTAISLAVAAIPEGLPVVVTVALALGVQRMVKRKALIRKLSAIETLGSVTLIAADKTGTMTAGKMVLTQLYANNDLIFVTGEGYETKGTFKTIAGKYDTKKLSRLFETAILCNNSQLQTKTGNPTELALLVAAKKAEIKTQFYRLDEIPFDSSKKYMATLDAYQNKKHLNIKGAPEIIVKKCKYLYQNGRIKYLTEKDREKILKVNERMARSALRVLALAYSKDGTQDNLIFLGLTGMMDPPREEAIEAVKLCNKAGIRVVMITGDHAITAQAVAKQLNLGTEVLTGEQLEKLPPERLKHLVGQIDIYARVNPEHKVKILQAFQENGEIVAMTGDGINDAPALKKADVGVAMGISGTDVSRESSDMVLLDDNFGSIVKAIKHGRRIFDNIKKFVKLLLSANLGEVG
ncbi:HAD-IC family P-type ATPase, partial [archaeon]|nr:HAD-IC family P-type ATPase [archaeon]